MSIVPIGIDLGTNNSCIAFVEGTAIKCVPNPVTKANTHASVVYVPPTASIDKSAVITVGQEAVNSGQTQPQQLIYCVKRLIGHTVVPQTNNFAYQVESDEGYIVMRIPQKDADELIYAPTDIYAFILSYLRRCAEVFFNPPDLDSPGRVYKTAEKVVITVPAAFNSEQRRLTRSAARLAGLDCLRILSEPTAAAMAYIYSHYHDPSFQEQRLDPDKPINLLMFDLGGGTFDVSIVSVAKEGFQVRSTAGNNSFGGEDIDSKIAEDIKRQYVKDCTTKGFPNSTFPTSERASRHLRKEAQKLKEKLSDQVSYVIDVEKSDWDLKIDFKWEYKRSRLEALLAREFERGCVPVVQDALKKASLTSEDIFQCVLVGGSTRIPYFRNSLEKLLNLPISRAINPDEAVSKGAAYLASYLVSKQLRQQSQQYGLPDTASPQQVPNGSASLLDFTEVSLARGELSAFSYSIGCGDDAASSLILAGSELPATGEHTFFLRHENPNEPLFDPAPVMFYIYEGQDKSDGSTGIEAPRRLFEISVARQRVETQSVSFYVKLDSDGVLDLFIVDEDEHFQIPNIDLPEIQALLDLNVSPQTSTLNTPAHGIVTTKQSQFSFRKDSTPTSSPNQSTPFPKNEGLATPTNTLSPPRRQSIAFNTSKRLPIKVPANIRNAEGKTTRPALQPPPLPRAPVFERLPDPPELLSVIGIPPPPTTQPVVPQTLADRFFAGYANPEFIFMKQYRVELDDHDIPPAAPFTPGMSPTPQPPVITGPSSNNRSFGNDTVTLNLPSHLKTQQPVTTQPISRPTVTTLDVPNFDDVDNAPTRPTTTSTTLPPPSISRPSSPSFGSALPAPPPGANLTIRRDSNPILPTRPAPGPTPRAGGAPFITPAPSQPPKSTMSVPSTAPTQTTTATVGPSRVFPPAPTQPPPTPSASSTNAGPSRVFPPVPTQPPPTAAPQVPSTAALRRDSNPFGAQPSFHRDSNPFGAQPQPTMRPPQPSAALPPPPTMPLPAQPPTMKPPTSLPPTMKPPSTSPPTMKPPGGR